METNSQNTKTGINYTLIMIVALVCASFLFGLSLVSGKNSNTSAGFGVLKSDLPLFISWRETVLPGHTQVAMIWPKDEAKLPLRITFEIEDSSTGKRYRGETVIEKFHTAKAPFEIGLLEGHQFVPGDRLILSHKDYSKIESTCASR